MTHELDSNLQEEAERARYSLRSSFYYRAHDTWRKLTGAVDGEIPQVYWDDRRSYGISDLAWDRVLQIPEFPHRVFCHPAIIQSSGRLIAYYRCLALLPQKGLQTIATNTKDLENGKGSLRTERALIISEVINGLISMLIESDSGWTLQAARSAGLLNLGSQINGSWRNEIGAEGARRVKQLVVAFLTSAELVKSLMLSDGTETDGDGIRSFEDVRRVTTSIGHYLNFGSEPDIAIRSAQGLLVATIEIKYGLDQAGALERYGAAKKSFDAAVTENARVINVYLASAITPEVRRRISEDRVVSREFNLTRVLSDAEQRVQFQNYLQHLLTAP